MQTYTVKQLSDLAGVSRRTLHFYDQIGLLKPEMVQGNGYRVYGRQALLRLQQILFYKELDFSLEDIGRMLDQPDFDLLPALEQHRRLLLGRQRRLDRLVQTVEKTIAALKGDIEMNEKGFFDGFTPEQEERYAQEAYQRWGDEVKQVNKKWKAYTGAQKKAILEEAGTNYLFIVEHMAEGPASAAVQQGVERWRQNLRHFYEPDIDRMRGLGALYNDDPDFHANLAKIHPDLPAFLHQAITVYCDRLER